MGEDRSVKKPFWVSQQPAGQQVDAPWAAPDTSDLFLVQADPVSYEEVHGM